MEGVLRKEERKRLESAVASSGTLDLSHAGMTTIDWSWVWRQTSLKRLLLDHNDLRTFRGPSVQEASKLSVLELIDVSHNKIERVEDDGLWLDYLALKETIIFNLENNCLSSLPPAYCMLLWSRPGVAYGRKYRVHPMKDAWVRSVTKKILTFLRLRFTGNERLEKNLLASTGAGDDALDPERLFDFWVDQCSDDDEVEEEKPKQADGDEEADAKRALKKAQKQERRESQKTRTKEMRSNRQIDNE